MIGYQIGACIAVIIVYVTNWPRPPDGSVAAALAVFILITSFIQIRRIRAVQRHITELDALSMIGRTRVR